MSVQIFQISTLLKLTTGNITWMSSLLLYRGIIIGLAEHQSFNKAKSK